MLEHFQKNLKIVLKNPNSFWHSEIKVNKGKKPKCPLLDPTVTSDLAAAPLVKTWALAR